MTKRLGFTLAEVLITLGIIGVVAAMTMPTLMNSTNGAQYKTAYKKALSVLSQAVVLNVALDDYDMSQTTSVTTNDGASLYNMFYNRMNVVKTSAGATSDEGWESSNGTTKAGFGSKGTSNYTLYFNDGITFTFPRNAGACTEGNKITGAEFCKGVIDVNGIKNPNKMAQCDGKNAPDSSTAITDCKVSNPTDIYPVIMYDQTILPNSDAARAVLYGAGK